ncbi:MAG: hypothetical protein P4L33_05850 [Capsulimonadaceae bacterium]|nr:hypothetical protein [Capsulimonadaceae bacterium]
MFFALVLRFLHIAGASVGFGGLVAAWAILPRLPIEARGITVRQFGKWIGIGLTVCVVSGIINASIQGPKHGDVYGTLMNIKGAAGLALFALSVLVFHPAPALKWFAERRRLCLSALVILGLIVIALGAALHGHYAATP